MAVAGWRAWYADGSVYSSRSVEWRELPPAGMVGVVVYFGPPYSEVLQCCDWWWMDENDRIHGVPTASEWGEWAPRPDAPQEAVKMGAGVSHDVWRRVHTEMMESAWP